MKHNRTGTILHLLLTTVTAAVIAPMGLLSAQEAREIDQLRIRANEGYVEDQLKLALIDCKTKVDCTKDNRTKIVFIVDLNDHTKWHFMRQQCNGKWTSKDGPFPVVNDIPSDTEYYLEEFGIPAMGVLLELPVVTAWRRPRGQVTHMPNAR